MRNKEQPRTVRITSNRKPSRRKKIQIANLRRKLRRNRALVFVSKKKRRKLR